MPSNRIAIVVSSPYGQTAKIARRIQSHLAGRGAIVDIVLPSDPLGPCDGVIIGAPVYLGKFAPEVVEWTKRNRAEINRCRSAFYSVSLNAADKRPEARAADDQLLRSFLKDGGIQPDLIASFAGCLHFTKYGWFKRWMMKRISAKNGGPTDTSKDHELTDWDQVDAFAEAYASSAGDSPFATGRRLPDELRSTAMRPDLA